MLHEFENKKAQSNHVNGKSSAHGMDWSVTARTTKLAAAYKAGELHVKLLAACKLIYA